MSGFLEPFVLYDVTDGRIVAAGYAGRNRGAELLRPGHKVLFGQHGHTSAHYVKNGQVVERPELWCDADNAVVAADGADPYVIKQIPGPSTITVRGPVERRFEVATSTVELTFDTPGSYIVRVDCFPTLGQEFIVDAT